MADTTVFFQQLRTHYKSKLPFVAYRKPVSNTIKGLLQENDQLFHSESISRSGFVFCSFSGDQKILIPKDLSTSLSVDFQSKKVDSLSNSTTVKAEAVTKDLHIQLVQNGISAISKNELVKVVLSRKQSVDIGSSDPISLFQNLLNTYANAFCYLWYHPKVGMWLGASPETFIKYKKGEFTTMSLAGTKPIIQGKDIEWDAKEEYEQQLVTDYITQQLKTVCTSNVEIKTDGVHTIKAGNVGHLKTTISLQLTDKKYLEPIIEALHPTPAVAGFPTLKAIEFIEKNEGYDRSFYTGYLGEIEEDRLSFFVNLRCMQLQDQHAIIYVGGGITAGSIPEKEWEETVHKSKTMVNILTN
ncbi:isochorismate synthase [Spongiivirga citrea]|uniref:isochorismate synthase n=1 Tax=Spongiivirga citrea TaxID=1481457 RepID=A0A6M0CFB6_9FLAO|nr:isochorismate synthase [Spongiivirga citrea]NER16471.1 isochorismate synthase [Spongiivirga citrea]